MKGLMLAAHCGPRSTPVRFAVAAQAGRCNVLRLTLNDLQLSLLGLNVDLSEVNLRIFAIRRGDAAGSWDGCSARCRGARCGSVAARAQLTHRRS